MTKEDGNMAQDTFSILDLVKDVVSEKTALPDFQRDFVWDIERTYDLFDSIVRNIFIGSIIFGKPKFGLAIREIDLRERPKKGLKRKALKVEYFDDQKIMQKCDANNFKIILDGQQRLTAICRALLGKDDIWFIIKNLDDIDQKFKECNFNELDLEDVLYEFDKEENQQRISIKLNNIYKFSTGEIALDEQKKKIFFESSFIKNQKDEEQSVKDEFFIKYLTIANKIQDLFKKDKLVSYYLLEMNTEKFTLFFERSNTKGITLSFVDILVAKLYTNFKLRYEIEKFNTNNPYKLDPEIITRTIALIVSNFKELKRSYILTELTADHFIKYWDDLCKCYMKVIDYLVDNHYIINLKWMPYDRMIIPLITFLFYSDKKTFNEITKQQSDFIEYWYWSSIYTNRYTSSTNDIIIKDALILKNVAENKRITDTHFFEKISNYSIREAQDLFLYSQKASAIYKGVLNFINYTSHGIKNWNDSKKIQLKDDIDDHHIFPKEFISNRFSGKEEEQYIDSVPNRTLIPKITNIKISDKSPSKYLNEKLLENSDLDKALISHKIPALIFSPESDNKFMEFLGERARLIFDDIILIKGKKEVIKQDWFQEFIPTDNEIKVFANYNGFKFDAVFNTKTSKINYNNEILTPSRSAINAINSIPGKMRGSQNGWLFWMYFDSNNEVQFIDNLRKY